MPHLQLHPPQSDTSSITHNVARFRLYSPLACAPLTFIFQALLQHCYNGQTLWQKQMLRITNISPPVQHTHKSWLQGCAASLPSTPHLVQYLCTLQTEHSSASIPNTALHFHRSSFPNSPCSLSNTNASKHSICLWNFHVIQANRGLLAGQVTLWLPNQETDPSVHH